MVIRWDKSYSVGVELFDSQHKWLIDIINTLVWISKNDGGGKETKTSVEMMSEIARYSREHLAAEEDAMEKYGYPDLENHRREHDKFRNMVKEIASKHDKVTTLKALKDWFGDHIMVTDKKYCSFFKDIGSQIK